ncbi:MAG: helicase-exonuclease AddAB subunit AddA [Planctomycetes bacterium]|nr:helicase-exonuclease AddAB subunit AddA [Planctomycetota bacterium]
MAEKKIKWTDQQKRAIEARGSDILVTASAGTGKTAVLSGRCVDIVSDKSLCPDVRNILVLTFTEAAAEQMRSRITGQLKNLFREKPDNHLRRQLMLIQGADISTIHSFCKRLITEYFYKLSLDPTFGVIDGDEQKLLKTEALEKTIDWAWQQSNLQTPLERLLYRRDLGTNDGFLTKIIYISDFLDGVVSRQDWYERAAQLAEAVNPFTTDIGEKQKQIVADKIQDILNQLQHAQQLAESKSADDQTEWLRNTHIKPVEECIEFINSGQWDKCTEAIRNYKKPKTYKPKGLSEPIAELLQKTAKNAVDNFKELSRFAMVNPDYLEKLSGSVGLQTRVLVELVKKFVQLYSRAKRTLNCLDFADLEHYALKLLTAEDSSQDRIKPSETALMLRKKYKYIFVDEYQDINSVQQQILDMLSPGGNVLEVGDVKQSIYAFRGAQPDIFLKQLKRASGEIEKASGGLRVDLNLNFRSAKGILDFVNKIFSRIMTASFTNIDYDESARLKPALEDEPQMKLKTQNSKLKTVNVEFHILDEIEKDYNSDDQKSNMSNGDENPGLVTSRQSQAAMIARRIRQMVGADTGKPEFQIYDKQQDAIRDVQYRDIVVLMRSLAKKANDYVEVFRLAGVPVSCQATAGYFQATEISDVLCLLKVLDNPQRDIELAAVLRSPFFKVSDSELAKIKIQSRAAKQHGNFYDCMLRYCSSATDKKLAGKLEAIAEKIKQWRSIGRRGNIADVLWQVYRETGYLLYVSALPNGQARRANLLKLHDRAIQFEGFASSTGIPSLTRFVEFIEKLQETGQDWAPAEPQASAGNSVRILSVHKSKGLEFPVVFLAELDSSFNKKDIHADILTDTDYTLGLQVIDQNSKSKLRSLAHEVIAEQKLSIALAEEMRILYVAATRARERLILTASQKLKTCNRIISNGYFFGDGPIPDWQLRSAPNPLEWILHALSQSKSLHSVFQTDLPGSAVDEDLFSFKFYDQRELRQLSEFVLKLKTDKLIRSSTASKKTREKRTESKVYSQVKQSLDWRYHFGDTYKLPAKNSVTQLTHSSDEYVKVDYSRAFDRQPKALIEQDVAFTKSVEPRLLGTATHLVISQLDLTPAVTAETIEKTKNKLIADNCFTASVAEHIDAESILAFFQSEPGKLVFDTENTVFREWPFTFALPASEFAAGASGGSLKAEGFGDGRSRDTRYAIRDTIIVQGIIDMLVRTPKGLVIIDFKTDRITPGQVTKRTELYRQQLEYYSRAASAVLKSECIAKWLYFLAPRVSTEV